MKKFSSLLLVLTLVFALVGCGNEKVSTSKPDTSAPTQTKIESIKNTETIEGDTENENTSDAEIQSSKPAENSEPVEPNNLTSSKPDDTVLECPNFIGKSLEKLESQYGGVFRFNCEWDHNNQYSLGVVYEQSVKSGEKIKKGSEIKIYISMGSETVKVPNVYDMTQSEAILELESKGFVVHIEKIDSSIEKGRVVKTKPERTTVVVKNEKITLYISTGIPNANESSSNINTNTNKDDWWFYCEHCGEFLGLVEDLKDDLSQSKTCTICNKKLDDAYLHKNGILEDLDIFE